MDLFSAGRGSSLWQLPKTVAAEQRKQQVIGVRVLCYRFGDPSKKTYSCARTVEVGDRIGDGGGAGDPLAAAGHVLPEQELREPLPHQLQLCNSTTASTFSIYGQRRLRKRART
jgi:hypothetical protein